MEKATARHPSALTLPQSKRVIRQLMKHHFGHQAVRKGRLGKAPEITPLQGGQTNKVFSVHSAEGNFVVRLGADAGKMAAFTKEQWAIAKAREQGVPTPEVLQVGNEAAPMPYMISRLTTGEPATFHPERMKIVREMGRYAAVINAIPTTGFGATFDWSHNQLSHNASWRDFLHHELKLEERLETLGQCGMLDAPRLKRLRAQLEGAAGAERQSVLNHGDLRLKNLLVNESGEIVCILDWEHCTSNLSPEWELSIALHDLSIDEKQELLGGYGLSGEQITHVSPVWKAITTLNYAPSVKRAAQARNLTKLQWHRLRLNGLLDLYY